MKCPDLRARRVAGCAIAIALVTIGACSKDPSGSPTSPSPPVQPGQLKRTKFLAFGDSITAGEISEPTVSAGRVIGFKLIQVLSAAYPTVLSSMLLSQYASQAPSIVVTNAGLSAEKAEFALPRFNTALDIYRPEVVLLMEGYNDICCGNNEVGVRKTEVGIGEMAAMARSRGARVFIGTLAPPQPNGSRSTPRNIVEDANAKIREVASAQGAYLVDVYTALLPDLAANIGPDGLHPTEIGYRRIAETFFAAIRADLEVR
ncbi:MAG: SGNH/GDSL hydrolase family protein [Vicinamibacterales bacterium]